MQSVHGEQFSRHNWEKLIKSRAASGSRVSFPEIEVELCNIPCYSDIIEEEDEEKKNHEGMLEKLIKEICLQFRLFTCKMSLYALL